MNKVPNEDKILKNLIAYYTLKIPKLASLKLIKLIYLTELAYFLRFNKRMTTIPFLYWTHGPYAKEIEAAAEEIDGSLIEIKEIYTGYWNEATVYNPRAKESDIDLSEDIKNIAQEIVSEFGNMSSKQIKEFVYSTSPFKETEKGDIINFKFLHTHHTFSPSAEMEYSKFMRKLKSRGYTPA